MNKNKKESQIEEHLRKKTEKLNCLCYKFVSPGNSGVPDRIIILPTGETVFIELKKEDGKLSELQRHQIIEHQIRHHEVYVLYSLSEVNFFLDFLKKRLTENPVFEINKKTKLRLGDRIKIKSNNITGRVIKINEDTALIEYDLMHLAKNQKHQTEIIQKNQKIVKIKTSQKGK